MGKQGLKQGPDCPLLLPNLLDEKELGGSKEAVSPEKNGCGERTGLLLIIWDRGSSPKKSGGA